MGRSSICSQLSCAGGRRDGRTMIDDPETMRRKGDEKGIDAPNMDKCSNGPSRSAPLPPMQLDAHLTAFSGCSTVRFL
jgi:hypothetical protein